MRLNRNEVATWAFGLSPGEVRWKSRFSNRCLPALELLKGWTTNLEPWSLTVVTDHWLSGLDRGFTGG